MYDFDSTSWAGWTWNERGFSRRKVRKSNVAARALLISCGMLINVKQKQFYGQQKSITILTPRYQ